MVQGLLWGSWLLTLALIPLLLATKPSLTDPAVSVSVVSGISGLLTVVIYVFFCMWIYRTAANGHVLVGRQLPMSAGWCVGWYFIPVAQLWMPCRGMMQTWRASQIGAKRPRGMRLITVWWVLYLTQFALALGMLAYSAVLGVRMGLADALSEGADPERELAAVAGSDMAAQLTETLVRFQVLGNLLTSVWTLSAILLVATVSRMQVDTARRQGSLS